MTTKIDLKHQNEMAVKRLRESIIRVNGDEYEIDQLFNKNETLSTIYYIMKKKIRNRQDIKILTDYLLTLDNFISIIQSESSKDEKVENRTNDILTKISKQLKVESYQGKEFLFRIGERGDKFYIILRGSTSVLKPQQKEIRMSKEQYISHLKMLYNLNEKYLLQETYLKNINVYTIPDKEIYVENKSMHSYLNSLDQYLSLLSASYIENMSFLPVVTIFYYVKVVTLVEGNSFGEIAIINENQQRTASIYINEKTIFGIVDSLTYKISIKSVQEKVKRERAKFILANGIFKGLDYHHFGGKIWNSFHYMKVKQGEFLFKAGEQKEKLFFLFNGQLRLSAQLTIAKLSNIINNLIGKENLKKNERGNNDVFNANLMIIDSRGVLGFDDLIINEKYFCNCQVISKIAILFVIEFKHLEIFTKIYPFIIGNYKKKENENKDIMIKTLEELLNTKKKSMIAECMQRNTSAQKFQKMFIPEQPKKKENKIKAITRYNAFLKYMPKEKMKLTDNNLISFASPEHNTETIHKYNTISTINNSKGTWRKRSNKRGSTLKKTIKSSEEFQHFISGAKDKQSPHLKKNNNNSYNTIPIMKEYEEKTSTLMNSTIGSRRNVSPESNKGIKRSRLYSACTSAFKITRQKLNSSEDCFFISQMKILPKDTIEFSKKGKLIVNYVDCLIMEKKNNESNRMNFLPMKRTSHSNRIILHKGTRVSYKRNLGIKTYSPIRTVY